MSEHFKRTPTRRSFVKQVLAGLVAFVPAAGVLMSNPKGILRASTPAAVDPDAKAPPPPPPPPPPGTPLFAQKSISGVVAGQSAAGISVKAGRGVGIVVVGPNAKVWKGDYDWGLPIEVGDTIKARGTITQEASGFRLDAETVWINIVNLIGLVSNVRARTDGPEFQLQDRHGRLLSLQMDARTLVNRPNTPEQAFGSNPISLANGQVIQVIGLDLRNGSVLARRVFLG